MCVTHENEHKWPFNILKLFILEKVTEHKVFSWLAQQVYANESLRHRQEWSCFKEIHLGMNNGVGNSSMGQC